MILVSRSLGAVQRLSLAKGAGETVTITGWAEREPEAGGLPVDHDPATGVWTIAVRVPERGWVTVELRAHREQSRVLSNAATSAGKFCKSATVFGKSCGLTQIAWLPNLRSSPSPIERRRQFVRKTSPSRIRQTSQSEMAAHFFCRSRGN